MEIEQIREAARRFRNGIESCVPELGFLFARFPRGACGNTTSMLGTYLIELKLGKFQYILGDYGCHENGTWSSHAWLQSNDLVVDITADQFPEIDEKVIVKRNSVWHAELNGKAQHLGDYRVYGQDTVLPLDQMYHRITECINAT